MEKFYLKNGIEIPKIGFGTSLVEGEECTNIILNALKIGYTHIDTAAAYKNEDRIGEAIKKSRISRKDLFITSKVWKDSMGYCNTIKSLNESLERLKVDYIDLFLIHWPKNNDDELNLQTWKALEDVYKQKKVRAIGVSNFLKKHLLPLMEKCEIIPMVNQLEYHPGLIRKETIEFCKSNKIQIEAWAPLGKGTMLKNDTLVSIAEKYNKSVAQICIKWCLQNNVLPLPKSSNIERMKENINVFDFKLSQTDMQEINNMKFFVGSNMDPNTFN